MDSTNAILANLSETVSVLLPLPLAGAYDYAPPAGVALAPGDFVRAPLGKREVIGVVWGPGSGTVATARIKRLYGKLDLPPMPQGLRNFIDWVANYTLSPPGAVLRMAMRGPTEAISVQPVALYHLAGPPPARLSAARAKVLAIAADGQSRSVTELSRLASVGTSVVRGLIASGTLIAAKPGQSAGLTAPNPNHLGPALSIAQSDAASNLRDAVMAKSYSSTLLEGVTGAGKTEVYFEAVAQALRQGQQALILLPEIALTVQFLARFEARFGVRPVEWHSELSTPKRRDAWRAVASGAARVVVGARSALFLPFTELGLIIVDEEHDAAFKQEDGVAYHARDMAVVRAHLAGVPIILSSATPSLETVVNVQAGRYRDLKLPDRYGGAVMPHIEAVDMRAANLPADKYISPRLHELMTETLARGEQVLLFLNRRGYAPLTLCRACGHRMECPNCSAWLVEHRFRKQLLCHHCGYSAAKPHACPACEVENKLASCGPGVERLAEEVAAAFPEITPSLISGDDEVSKVRDTIEAFTRGETKILIGTQIVAKGHHFPGLTLVGVIDADLGLAGGDLRAAERTFQLLHQVSGRAGRAERPGHALLQTYMPEHPVMQALVSGDRETFLNAESTARRGRGLPPFGRLVALIVSGPELSAVRTLAQTIARTAPSGERIQVLGPAAAPLSQLRGRHRYRLLLMAERQLDVQRLLHNWLGPLKLPSNVRLMVDVDPYSFL